MRRKKGRDMETEGFALQSVHMEGRLDGLMLSMTAQQRYCNETGKNLEMLYTFPLAWEATLMGMDVDIAGKRLQATVIEKKKAHQQYEKAIDKGDTPVMVEQSATGLYNSQSRQYQEWEKCHGRNPICPFAPL